MKLTTHIIEDDIVRDLSQKFDVPFSLCSETEIQEFIPPQKFTLGVIVGPSGSGKSSLLRHLFSVAPPPAWDYTKAVASHFQTTEETISRLGAVGFGTIPAWLRPFQCLSTGEQFRADLARQIDSFKAVDEFTSVVDRTVARSCATALGKYLRATGVQNFVLATCHYDVIRWLVPDWVYDMRTHQLFTGRWQSRPRLSVEILPSSSKIWPLFSQHHYLTAQINAAARCWVAVLNHSPIGFASALAFPNGNFTHAWREHRTVILPDYQGLGLGVRLSDAIARIFVSSGHRYFSKTAHPRMGFYRNHSLLWRPTSKNMKSREDYRIIRVTKESGYKHLHQSRCCFSHEFVGP
jgi:GNAT superfamily N-acetyltransferase